MIYGNEETPNTKGCDLKAGDTIRIWWKPGRDTIVSLRAYDGPLECLKNARLAEFALNRAGMTIPADDCYEVVIGAKGDTP